MPIVLLSLAMAVGALLLIAVQFDTFQSRLPAFHQFFGPHNWLWLFLILSGTKILHEFGHGLACKRFGGECHEMGVMFLVLTPCLYCNVSDSWMLPSKWRRAAIGAAGMYIELILAAICTFLWWFSEPGLLNFLCLNVMFVCSVSTLLFNANPLLRYDGYYILSDVLEIPNLRQKSSTILRRKLGSWFLGLPYGHDPFLPHRHQSLFAIYAIAAAVYRWVVALAILWFLNKVFEPHGFKILGQLLACVTVYGLLIHPFVQLFKFFRIPGRIDRVRKVRFLGAASICIAAVLLIGMMPLPHYVTCSVVIQPRAATTVYVEVPGQIQQVHVQPGQTVNDGQPLLTLANIDAEVNISELEAERARERARLTNLHQSAVYGDETAAAEIAEAEETLATLDEQLEMRRKRIARLMIASPVAGTIIPASTRPEPNHDADRLPTWSGTPLKLKNVGAFLEDGTIVCQIGNPNQLNAVLAIDQQQIEFVQEGQEVEIFLDQLPGEQIDGRVSVVSQVRMKSMPLALSSKAGGDVSTKTDDDGRERPTEATYQANVQLPPTPHVLLSGATGTAKIRVGTQSLGRRCWRYLCQTFNFEL